MLISGVLLLLVFLVFAMGRAGRAQPAPVVHIHRENVREEAPRAVEDQATADAFSTQRAARRTEASLLLVLGIIVWIGAAVVGLGAAIEIAWQAESQTAYAIALVVLPIGGVLVAAGTRTEPARASPRPNWILSTIISAVALGVLSMAAFVAIHVANYEPTVTPLLLAALAAWLATSFALTASVLRRRMAPRRAGE